jgi:hypothetical protein
MNRREVVLAAFCSAALFGLSCLVPRGGLLSSEPFVDVGHYAVLSKEMLAGQLPYRDFFFEYLPGAVGLIAIPGWISEVHYQTLFRVEMLACGIAAIAGAFWCLQLVGASRRRLWLAGAALGLAPLALGPVLLNGYDLWPAALTVVAVALLVAGRLTAGGALVGLGAAAKLFTVALLPLALRRRTIVAAAAAFAVVCLPAAVVGPGGLRFSVWVQAKRGLHCESLGGSLLLALGHPQLALRPPGSLDVLGGAATSVAGASTVVVIAAIFAVAILARRAPPSRETLLLACVATVVGFVAFGKAFSPQYLVWLVPLVPLVSVPGTALLAAAAVLTHLWVLRIVTPFDPGGPAWIAVLRNLLVVGIYALLVRRLVLAAASRTSASAPAAQSTKKLGRLA